jgi:hypothetical protein
MTDMDGQLAKQAQEFAGSPAVPRVTRCVDGNNLGSLSRRQGDAPELAKA